MSIKFKLILGHITGLILLIWALSAVAELEGFKPVTPDQSFAVSMLDAFQNPRPWPVFTGTMDTAYLKQMRFIQLLDEPVIGFKAGLTSAQAQTRFATTGPVSGVLTESMLSHEELRRSSFVRPMLEMELGFVLRQTINKPLDDITAVRRAVKDVLAVIEIPDLGFESGPPSGPIIVAANVAVRRIIRGGKLSNIGNAVFEKNKLRVELRHDGESVMFAETEISKQLETLRWLINHNLAAGHEILAGHLFITGVIGTMQEAEVGHYQADFMGIDQIAFEIRP